MKKVMPLIWVTFGVLLGLVIAQPLYFYTGALYSIWTHPKGPSAAAAEQAAREQVDAALPNGSKVEEVEAWLDSQHRYHLKGVDDKGHPYVLSGWPIYSGWLYRLDLDLGFDFDKDGKLSSKQLRVESTSL